MSFQSSFITNFNKWEIKISLMNGIIIKLILCSKPIDIQILMNLITSLLFLLSYTLIKFSYQRNLVLLKYVFNYKLISIVHFTVNNPLYKDGGL